MSGVGILDVNKSTISYTWKIDNIQTHLKNLDTRLLSPVFSLVYFNNVTKWRLRLHSRSKVEEWSDSMSAFLDYLSEEKIAISFRLGIPSYYTFEKNETIFDSQHASYGFNQFIERSDVIGETLNLLCEISFKQPIIVPRTVHDQANSNLKKYSLTADLDKLFDTETMSDVTVDIGGEKKHLHKVLLANRSEVFRAMFQHEMVEKEKSVVNIVDIELEVGLMMFKYIYTDTVNDIEKFDAGMVEDLLIAAEKYAVTGLRLMCEETLCIHLNFGNALRYLKLSVMHNAIYLKTQVISFIVNNPEEFIDEPEFKSLDQDILCQLFSALAKKKE